MIYGTLKILTGKPYKNHWPQTSKENCLYKFRAPICRIIGDIWYVEDFLNRQALQNHWPQTSQENYLYKFRVPIWRIMGGIWYGDVWIGLIWFDCLYNDYQ